MYILFSIQCCQHTDTHNHWQFFLLTQPLAIDFHFYYVLDFALTKLPFPMDCRQNIKMDLGTKREREIFVHFFYNQFEKIKLYKSV